MRLGKEYLEMNILVDYRVLVTEFTGDHSNCPPSWNGVPTTIGTLPVARHRQRWSESNGVSRASALL